MAKPQKSNSKKTLTKTFDERELAEYVRRHQLCEHYRQVYDTMKASLLGWQNYMRKIHDLPENYQVNLKTGVVTWEMTKMEEFMSKGGK